MRVLFDEGWAVGEDSTGEFASAVTKNPDLRVIFWEDVHPTRLEHDLEPVKGVPGTADDVVGWLRAYPNLSVTTPRLGTIGSDLPAIVVDVSVAAKAENDDPGCPAKPCASSSGSLSGESPTASRAAASRASISSDVKYGGKPHLLVAAVEGLDRAQLEAGLPAAERLIASAEVPAEPA